MSAQTAALKGRKIVLGVTGSIAAYKACALCRLLIKAGAEVQVVMTEGAAKLVAPHTFMALSGHPVATDIFKDADTALLQVKKHGKSSCEIYGAETEQ